MISMVFKGSSLRSNTLLQIRETAPHKFIEYISLRTGIYLMFFILLHLFTRWGLKYQRESERVLISWTSVATSYCVCPIPGNMVPSASVYLFIIILMFVLLWLVVVLTGSIWSLKETLTSKQEMSYLMC